MSEKPEDATNTAAAAEPTPAAKAAQPALVPEAQPAQAPASRNGFLHGRGLQLAAVGLLGLLLGCLIGGCVVAAVASHMGGGYNRYDEDRRHDRYRDGDRRDWGPYPERPFPHQPNLPPPIVPPPNVPPPIQPTPVLPTPRTT